MNNKFKMTAAGLILFSSLSHAQLADQQTTPEGIAAICSRPALSTDSSALPVSMKLMSIGGQTLSILDHGFCNEYKLMQDAFSNQNQNQNSNLNLSNIGGWKLSIYAGHSFTHYFNSDIQFRSSRYNVDIKDYEWAERGSRKYFMPATWKQPGNNPFQFIDEPSNIFSLCLDKGNHQFCLTAFHPKFLQANDQTKYMSGNIDGTDVNGYAPINRPFDGYNQTPGESELVRNQNSHRQMNFEIGYGYKLKLATTRFGSLTYVPSVGIGVMTGENYTVMIQENQWWDFDDYTDKYRVQGIGGSINNRIEYTTPNGKFGVYYQNKLAYFHQHHGFMDGTQTYNLGLMSNNVGFKFSINSPKKRR
jgi:hypothetical protein